MAGSVLVVSVAEPGVCEVAGVTTFRVSNTRHRKVSRDGLAFEITGTVLAGLLTAASVAREDRCKTNPARENDCGSSFPFYVITVPLMGLGMGAVTWDLLASDTVRWQSHEYEPYWRQFPCPLPAREGVPVQIVAPGGKLFRATTDASGTARIELGALTSPGPLELWIAGKPAYLIETSPAGAP